MNEPETMKVLSKNEPLMVSREEDDLFVGLNSKNGLGPGKITGANTSRGSKSAFSKEQTQYLETVFEELDSEGIGRVRKKGAVYTDFLTELIRRKLAAPVMKKCVPLSNDELTFNQLISLLSPYWRHFKASLPLTQSVSAPTLPQSKIEEYRRLFDSLDRNSNGSLDAYELQTGLKYSFAEVEHMMTQYDFDKNRELEFFEFVKMLAPEGCEVPIEVQREYQEKRPRNQTFSIKKTLSIKK